MMKTRSQMLANMQNQIQILIQTCIIVRNLSNNACNQVRITALTQQIQDLATKFFFFPF